MASSSFPLPKKFLIVIKILRRQDDRNLLPVLNNQKSNAFLKEIAALCDINKPLTTHLARHTFATTITLTNGVPIESVSKMLGHKDLRTPQHYAKIVERKISDDMTALKLKLEEKKRRNLSFLKKYSKKHLIQFQIP